MQDSSLKHVVCSLVLNGAGGGGGWVRRMVGREEEEGGHKVSSYSPEGGRSFGSSGGI